MRTITHIHCYSCGRDGTTSEIPQKIGNTIKRCGNCHSLNFRVIQTVEVEEEQPEDYHHLEQVVMERDKA